MHNLSKYAINIFDLKKKKRKKKKKEERKKLTQRTKKLYPHFAILSHRFLIIIMYIYRALINALSAHMIHINLNMIFYTHVEHNPTKTIYIKYY